MKTTIECYWHRRFASIATTVALAGLTVACDGKPEIVDGPSAEPEPPAIRPFSVEFEEIPHDSELVLTSDMAFVPGDSGDLVILSREGELQYLTFDGEQAEVVGAITIPNVLARGSSGAVSVTFDPDYEDNRFIYVARSQNHGVSVLSRFTLDIDDPQATLASGVVIFQVEEPAGRVWHNITAVGFERNGTLWATVGEKGVPSNAQDAGSLMGGLVRLIPSREPEVGGYEALGSSGFFGQNSRPELFSMGLRSPWRALYHQGEWIVGDVGHNSAEELNLVSAEGLNFGWPYQEGACSGECEGLTDPWVYYTHDNDHPFVRDDLDGEPTTSRAIYAGWAYQPNREDPYGGLLDDHVLFGDVYVGFVRARSLVNRDEPSFHVGHLLGPTGWGQGVDGYVYVWTMGTIPGLEFQTPCQFFRMHVNRLDEE
jgi:glucose/arabinose dehydrogenase